MDYAFRVLAVDDGIILRVGSLQASEQPVEPFGLIELQGGLTHLGADGGYVVDATANSVDVHHRTAAHHRIGAAAEQLRQQLHHVFLELRCAVVVVEILKLHKVVRHGSHLLGSWGSSPDGYFAIDLTRVSRDDVGAQRLSHGDGSGCLAHSSGTSDYD